MESIGIAAVVGLTSWVLGKTFKHAVTKAKSGNSDNAGSTSEPKHGSDASTKTRTSESAGIAIERLRSTQRRGEHSQEASAIPVDLPTPPVDKLRTQKASVEMLARFNPQRSPRWDRRICVFDTNAIINDPHCIYWYGPSDICIPHRVLQELDGLKNSPKPNVAFMARRATDMFLTFRAMQHPEVKDAHPIFLRVRTVSAPALFFPRHPPVNDIPGLRIEHPDDQIAAVAFEFKKIRKDVLFVTGDKNLALRSMDLVETRLVKPKSRKEFEETAPLRERSSGDLLTQDAAHEEHYLQWMFDASRRRPEMANQVFGEMLRAAEGGNAFAQKIVGGLYFLGEGTEPNRNAACQWFARAARQGDFEALDVLETLARSGPGVPDLT
nr:PIN domain-containing protein [uncultured Roseateles sp.]